MESEVENVDIDNLGLDRRYDFPLPLHLTSQTSQAGWLEYCAGPDSYTRDPAPSQPGQPAANANNFIKIHRHRNNENIKCCIRVERQNMKYKQNRK